MDDAIVSAYVHGASTRDVGKITEALMGEEAEQYHFTSALPVQVLKALSPVLARHLGEACVASPGETYLTRKGPTRAAPQKVAVVPALSNLR